MALEDVDDLLEMDEKFDSTTITYSFDSSSSTWDGWESLISPEEIFDDTTKADLTSPEQTAFATAISLWDDFSAFSISSASGKGDVNIYQADFETSNFASTGLFETESDDTFDRPLTGDFTRAEIAIDTPETISDSGFGFWLALHEFGHAVGLTHPDNNPLNLNYDTMKTVMSYNYPGRSDATVTVDHWAITPMAYDIAALKKQYGTFTHNNGNSDVYDATSLGIDGTQLTAQTIVDTGGTGDKIDLSGVSGNHIIDLREAIKVEQNGFDIWIDAKTIVNGKEWIFIARDSVIENATGGTGDDQIRGNDSNNVLAGGSGDDILHSSKGSDSLYGGTTGETNGDTANYSHFLGYTKVTLTDVGEGTVDKYEGQADDGGSADSQDDFYSIEKFVFGSLGGVIVGESTGDDIEAEGSGEIQTGTGDDTVTVSGKGAVLDLGDGDDLINILSGASHVVVRNDGDSSTDDTLTLHDIAPEDVIFVQVNDNLDIYVNDVLTVTLEHHFDSAGFGIDDIVIDDGVSPITVDATSLTSADLAKLAVSSVANWHTNYRVWFGTDIAVIWDPLVIDLDSDGIETVAFATGTHFDLNGDDYAEVVGWLGADDGFLARDINDNGQIDDGTELFGNATTDGFSALAAFDANADGLIDSQDSIWSDLVVWKDLNGDAYTQSDELLTLASLNITGIDVANVTTTSTQNNAGTITHTGKVTTSTGTLDAANMNLFVNTINTRYAADYDYDARAAFLPNIRGYNTMAELSIALSLDNDEQDPDSLMALMLSAVSRDFTDFFENYGDVKDDLKAALFRWAGVDGVSPTSRGDYVDAREIGFIEAVLGQAFVDLNFTSGNPGAIQGQEIHDLFNELFSRLTGNILIQSFAGTLFEDGIDYNFATDVITSSTDISTDALDALEAHATGLSTTGERLDFWVNVATFIADMRAAGYSNGTGFAGLATADETAFKDAIEASDANLAWHIEEHDPGSGVTAVEYRLLNPVGETYTGTSGADDLDGSANADVLIGDSGADDLFGDDGNDALYGHNEDGSGDDNADDVVNGGDGDDFLSGGGGSDVLIGGNGSDHILGGAGSDTLIDGSGSNFQNLLEGGDGNDAYLFHSSANPSSMYIVETDGGGTDDLKFVNSPSAAADDVKFILSDMIFTRLLDDHINVQAVWGSNVFNVTIDNQLTDLEDSTGVGIEFLKVYDTHTSSTYSWLDLKDHLLSWTGEMNTIGTAFDDTIYGITIGSLDDFIQGFGGNDILYGDDGDDRIEGDDGDDEIHGGEDDDTLYGDDGQDVITGDAGNDILHGGDDIDTLYGGDDNDFLYGENDNDYLDGGTGNDSLSGGLGDDTFVFSSGNDTYAESGGTDIIQMTAGMLPENLAFSVSSLDVIINVTTPVTGQITVSQQLNATEDYRIDSIVFDDGFSLNFLEYSGWDFDTNTDPESDETINGLIGGGNTVIGRGGTDRIYGANSASSWDQLSGGAGDDFLYGNTGHDFLHGGSGNDELYGEVGNDHLWGSTGDDLLNGGSGNDVIDGGDGTDTLDYSAETAGVTVNLATGTATDGSSDTDTLSNIENVLGSDYSDTITGDIAANVIDGGSGNDTIAGGAGDDTITDGQGNDTLTGGTGEDVFIITDQASATDTVTDFSIADDQIDLNAFDAIFADFSEVEAAMTQVSSDTEIDLGDGQTLVLEGITATALTYGNFIGNAGINPVIYGTSGNDTLNGTSGADVISPLAGTDTVNAGDGNDRIIYTDGFDTYDGGNGTDVIDFSTFGYAVYTDLQVANYEAKTKYTSDVNSGGSWTFIVNLSNVENIIGSDYHDELRGNTGANIISGGAGDDDLYGASGDDVYEYNIGDGDDWIFDNATSTNDVIRLGPGIEVSDLIFAIVNNDDLEITFDGVATDSIVINNHINTSAPGVMEKIVLDDQSEIALVASITGTSGDDVIYGTVGNDTLSGSGGNDTFYGGFGHDTITGGDGNDVYVNQDNYLYVAGSYDNFDGGAGTDTADFSGYIAAIKVDIYAAGIEARTRGGADLSSGTWRDVANLTSVENIVATAYHDDLYGSTSDNSFWGGAGDDTINGYTGNDLLYGEAGNDTLTGADGNDMLDGGAGDDTLYGNAGNDTFVYSAGLDSITDNGGTDTLWITGGVTVNDISFTNVSTYHTKITVASGTDEITVNYLRHGTASNHVDTITFDDGFYANLPSYQGWLNGTSGNDMIAGNGNANVLIGFAGDDDIDAGAGNDNAHGGAGADTIHGDAGDDLLYGGTGDDILYGDDDLDTLLGGAGADTFVFENASAFNDVDVIKDFSLVDNDLIDLIDIMDATSFDPQQDAITDWIEMTTVGNDTALKVDRDGTGGTYSMQQIATLEGVTGLTDEAALVSSGNLLLAA